MTETRHSLVDKALDAHTGTVELMRSPKGHALAEALLNRKSRTHGRVANVYGPDPENELASTLSIAPTYAVTNHMLTIIEHGWAELSSREKETARPLDLDWLPSPNGYVLFERPVEMPTTAPLYNSEDDKPLSRPVAGVFWFTGPILTYRYASVFEAQLAEQTTPDKAPPPVEAVTKQGVMLGLIVHKDHAFTEGADLTGAAEYWPFDVTGWSEGSPWKEVSYEEWQESLLASGKATPAGSAWRWFMVAMWAMMTDRVTLTPASRHSRRRAGRVLGTPAEEVSKVRVVTLRRENPNPSVTGEESTGGFEYDHRFLVSGHWRWQPHGRGRNKVKLIWIAPYVKGPEHKPLIIKDTVHLLKR